MSHTAPSVLLVDDDPSVATMVSEALTDAGFEVECAATGAEAEAVVKSRRPDVVLLDIQLPDADGLLLCDRFVSRLSLRVVMFTGSTRHSDRILSFRLGADDFVAKPVHIDELVARIRAVLRRGSYGDDPSPTNGIVPERVSAPVFDGVFAKESANATVAIDGTIRVGELVIDARRRRVAVLGQAIVLTATQYRLLAILAAEPERVFSRDELSRALWGDESLEGSRAIDVHIRRLRARLEPFGSGAPTIGTARGFGYTLRP